MFVRDNFKLLFIHPPKTGGISIGSFLLENGFRYTQEHLSEELKIEYMKYGNHHVDATLIPNIEYDYVFSVFRDPIERLKSGYKHRFSTQMTFEDFIEEGFSNYSSKSSKMIDHIIKPQVEYYTKTCEVFLYENIKKIPEYLNERNIRVSGNLKYLNRSNVVDIFISDNLKQKIIDFYKEDYLFFKSLLSSANT